MVADFCADYQPFSNGRGLKGAAALGLSKVPDEFMPIERRKLRRLGRDSNTKKALQDAASAYQNYQTEKGLSYGGSEAEIENAAQNAARECRAKFTAFPFSGGSGVGTDGVPSRGYIDGVVSAYGAAFAVGVSDIGARLRAECPTFWRRHFRKVVGRGFDGAMRDAGRVHRQGELFCADVTVTRRIEREKRNIEILEGLQVVDSDSGESLVLADVVRSSVSNPALRRAELMTRARGFEEYSIAKGHKALFITATCPSAYHRVSEAGRRVAAFNGSDPRAAQAYLLGCWSKVRAAWSRGVMIEGRLSKVRPYGFRVVEPHHDGTPHWHLVLFVRPEMVNFVSASITEKFLAESPDEHGAKKNRVQIKVIDSAAGGATAYLAKYISKNVDGLGLDGLDSDEAAGSSLVLGAVRVLAWANRWGIRQFQQIGGASVTVWRELRRVAGKIQGDLFERVRVAADSGSWVDYFAYQGGSETGLRDQAVKPVLADPVPGVYGDMIAKIKGLRLGAQMVLTRLKEWAIERRDRKAQRGSVSTRSRVNNCTDHRARFQRNSAAGLSEFARNGQISGAIFGGA